MFRRPLGSQAYTRLVPYYPQPVPLFIGVNMAPSTTIARGTVLGTITNAADDVQTISDTGTVSGGTFTISGVDPRDGESFTTDAIAYNAATSVVQAALEEHLGTGNVAVTGGPLPGTDVVLTFGGALADRPITLMTIDSASLTGGGSLAIAHTTVGRTASTVVAYDDDGTDDGRRVAKYIAQYDMESDADGYIYIGELVSGRFQRFEGGNIAVDVYASGVFATSELVGLDAAAVADLNAKIIKGTLADGLLQIPG